jgi:glycosyltransferase involved in cell wall biosynthesis
MNKLVSVVIPAFNSEPFITNAIDSALTQDYANKEVIVVDDGSTDNTAELVKEYGSQVNFIRQGNSGPGAARNRGVAASGGEYIAFLDSDDFWLPGKLTAQVNFLERRPDIALLFHDWLVVNAGSEEDLHLRSAINSANIESSPVDHKTCEDGWLYNALLFDSIMTTISVMMRRSLFDKLNGFDESLPQGQDYDLWLRASRETRIAKLCARLAVISIRPGSITTTLRPVNYRAHILERALARWGRIGPDGAVTPKRDVNMALSLYWFDFAYGHSYNGDRNVAIRSFYKSLMLNPLQLNAWLHLVRVSVIRLITGSRF